MVELLDEQKSKIRVLDDRTINQVAAGEVIESPASVVKELVENAIDAKATEISIEIVSGGRNLIRITDNGCGMTQDDAFLAFERHATSKLKKLDDLDDVLTMGFRGEALPSIASIAKCTLKTSMKEQGTKIVIHGGKILCSEPCVMTRGTEIEVRSLFYNVPVRRKFQKSVGRDIQSIISVFTDLSLANPHCKLSLKSEGKNVLSIKEVYQKPKEELVKNRITETLGDAYFINGHYFSMEDGEFSAYGLLGDPTQTRGSRSGQHLIVNGRVIQSSFVSKLMKQCYGTRIPSQRHPVFVINLKVPPSYIDVNVHPQKREIRFRKEEEMTLFLEKVVSTALTVKEPAFEIKEDLSFQKPVETVAALAPPPSEETEVLDLAPWELEETPVEEAPSKVELRTQPLPMYDLSIHGSIGSIMMISSNYLLNKLEDAYQRKMHKQSWIMVHESRARFRLYYDALAEKDLKIASQKLLIPIHVNLSKKEMQQFSSISSTLHELGFSFRPFGNQELLLEEVPNFLSQLSMDTWIKDILQGDAVKFVKKDLQEKLRVQIALYASKSRASLSDAEKNALIKDVCQLKEWIRTPLGKPIFEVITEDEIKRKYFS